jgi:hypothetical protein
MLKAVLREVMLTIQARNGLNIAVLVWTAVMGIALATAFAFACVAGYDALALVVGSVFAGLIMAGIFILVALLSHWIAALARRRARERAVLARAARAHAPSWMLDPRLLSTAVQAGRSLGWQRIVPVVLFGFMAAQWARDYREKERQNF